MKQELVTADRDHADGKVILDLNFICLTDSQNIVHLTRLPRLVDLKKLRLRTLISYNPY